jgi:hypothetical protein
MVIHSIKFETMPKSEQRHWLKENNYSAKNYDHKQGCVWVQDGSVKPNKRIELQEGIFANIFDEEQKEEVKDEAQVEPIEPEPINNDGNNTDYKKEEIENMTLSAQIQEKINELTALNESKTLIEAENTQLKEKLQAVEAEKISFDARVKELETKLFEVEATVKEKNEKQELIEKELNEAKKILARPEFQMNVAKEAVIDDGSEEVKEKTLFEKYQEIEDKKEKAIYFQQNEKAIIDSLKK